MWLESVVVRELDLLQLMAMSSNPCNMAIFQFFSMAAAAIVDFKIFKFFDGWNVPEGQTASLCQISLKSAKTRPRYRDLSIFQDGSAAILDFKNFKFLMVGAV